MHACRRKEDRTDERVDLTLLAPVLETHAGDTGALMPVLQDTQRLYGYLPEDALREIARARRTPLSHVYGVATFYAQFHLQPLGERLIRICHGTACHVRGAPEVTRAVVEELGVKVGETTPDLRFTLESVACVGCCSLAPVMVVDGQTYGQLDIARTRIITATLREGGSV